MCVCVCVCAAPLKDLSLFLCVLKQVAQMKALSCCVCCITSSWVGETFFYRFKLCVFLWPHEIQPPLPPSLLIKDLFSPCTSLTKHSLLIHTNARTFPALFVLLCPFEWCEENSHTEQLLSIVSRCPPQQKGRRHVVTASSPGRKRTTVENHFRWGRKLLKMTLRTVKK